MAEQSNTGTHKQPRKTRRKLLWEVVGLQTPAGRLSFFAIITFGVFVVPFSWLENLSLWKRLDIPSPSIGLTRSYWRILHGDFVGAWQQNKLIFVVILIGGGLLMYDIYKLIVSQRRAKQSVHTNT
jgi:hypothetical protein